MANIATSSPYLEDIKDKEGRVAIQSTPEEWFNTNTNENPGGKDKTVPYEFEFGHTAEGDFVVFTRDSANNVIPLSASRELRKKIEKWESEHIFENAEAFMFNSQVNVLYFDNDRMTVKISPERTFSSAYAYWAITGADGKYYTGITKSDGTGDISSNLVQTEQVKDVDGNVVAVTCSGHLVNRMVHGHNYIVKFYDADGILANQMTFQAMGVRNMANNVSPEESIVDVVVSASNHATGTFEDTLKLYQGQSWKDLGFRIYLIYGNGEARDVTAEWSTDGGTVGRVRISGLTELNTDSVTGTGDDPQKFTVRYYTSQANIDNPLVDPDDLSIKHEYSVYIVPNPNDDPIKILPVLWMERTAGSTGNSLAMRLVSLNAYGDTKDITVFTDLSYRLRGQITSQGLMNFTIANADDPNTLKFLNATDKGSKSFSLDIPYGTMSSKAYQFNLSIPTSELYPRYSVSETGVNEPVKETKFFGLKTLSTGSPRLFLEIDSDSSAATNGAYIEKLKEAYSYTSVKTNEAIIPTHIRIRSGKNPSIWNAGVENLIPLTTDIMVNGFAFNTFADENGRVEVGTPLIVEFIHYDETLNKSVVTSIETFYVKDHTVA